MTGWALKLKRLLFGRATHFDGVRTGASYRRVLADRTVELAEVVALFPDPYGIPHIRFDLQIERPGLGRHRVGTRTVALKVFCASFGARPLA